MTRSTVGAVTLVADLAVEVDGRPVEVTADGDEVLIRLADPAHVLAVVTSAATPAGAPRAVTRRSLRGVADGLAGHGVTVVVEGPSGRLGVVGARAGGNRWIGTALGTRHVRLGPWSAVGPVARPVLLSALDRGLRSVRARLRRR